MFIAHSFLDKKLILTLMDLFNIAGYSVYADWINDKIWKEMMYHLKRLMLLKIEYLIVNAYLISPLGILLIQNSVGGDWVWQKACKWEIIYFTSIGGILHFYRS